MKIIIQILVLLIFISCETETEITTNTTNKLLENGKVLKVSKTTEKTTQIGAFTNYNYGTSILFKYSFTINNDAKWDGQSTEPKNIFFTKDTIYLKSLQKKSVPHHYTANDTIVTKYIDTIVPKYEVYIDNRYFFKMLGDDFWIDIPSKKYTNATKNNTTFNVPNDNEYQIIEKIKRNYKKDTLKSD